MTDKQAQQLEELGFKLTAELWLLAARWHDRWGDGSVLVCDGDPWVGLHLLARDGQLPPDSPYRAL